MHLKMWNFFPIEKEFPMNWDVRVISSSWFRLNLLRCFVDGWSHAATGWRTRWGGGGGGGGLAAHPIHDVTRGGRSSSSTTNNFIILVFVIMVAVVIIAVVAVVLVDSLKKGFQKVSQRFCEILPFEWA